MTIPANADHELTATPGAPKLLDEAVGQLRRLGVSEEVARLFPNGLESLHIDINVGTGALSIDLKAAASGPGPVADDEEVRLSGGVQPSFNAEGHKVVVLIAAADLQQRFPATMTTVNRILDEGGRDLLTAAIFPDIIRNSQPETKPFHFVDFELEAGVLAPPDLPTAPHVITEIDRFSRQLRAETSAERRVDDLSWLFHLFGDIHQPMHCVTRISSAHPRPDGDRGGNSFALRGRARNLHALWDSATSFTGGETEQQIADSIQSEHTRRSLADDLMVTDVERWARRGFELARQHAYAPLVENPASPPRPSAFYLDNAQKVGRRQAALAGYRLADRLHEILG